MSKFVLIWLDFLNQLMDLSHLLKNTFYICCGLKNRLLFLYVINKYCLSHIEMTSRIVNGFQDYGNAILEICKTVRKLSKSLSIVLCITSDLELRLNYSCLRFSHTMSHDHVIRCYRFRNIIWIFKLFFCHI